MLFTYLLGLGGDVIPDLMAMWVGATVAVWTPNDGSGFTTISYLLHTMPIHQTRLQYLRYRRGGRFSTGTVDGSKRERMAQAACA